MTVAMFVIALILIVTWALTYTIPRGSEGMRIAGATISLSGLTLAILSIIRFSL